MSVVRSWALPSVSGRNVSFPFIVSVNVLTYKQTHLQLVPIRIWEQKLAIIQLFCVLPPSIYHHKQQWTNGFVVLQFDSIWFLKRQRIEVYCICILFWTGVETDLCHFYRKKMRLQGQLHLCSRHPMCLHFCWLPRRSSLHKPHLSPSSHHQNVCNSFLK